MKNAMSVLLVAVLFALGGICDDGKQQKNKNDRIIALSHEHWNYVKNTVDTNGWCRIPKYHTVIVITNGITDIEYFHYFFLDGKNEMVDRVPERSGSEFEPQPYQGQRL